MGLRKVCFILVAGLKWTMSRLGSHQPTPGPPAPQGQTAGTTGPGVHRSLAPLVTARGRPPACPLPDDTVQKGPGRVYNHIQQDAQGMSHNDVTQAGSAGLVDGSAGSAWDG